jgi:hypothetical protein
MRALLLVVTALIVALVAAMSWQHLRYQRLRRGPVQDLQRPVYGGATFHVLTLLRFRVGEDPIEALRKLRGQIESGSAAEMVYAGRIALVALPSSQLPETAWEAAVLVQHPSRAAYDAAAKSTTYKSALEAFPDSYSIGADRSALLNLAIPQLLLAVRARQIVTRQPSIYPLTPSQDSADLSRAARGAEARAAFESVRELSEEAVVVVNLLKEGTAEQRKADSAYGFAMAQGFAEGAYGPMHMAKAVTLEGDAQFDRVALVYYPGIDYFQELMGSTFFNGIVGGKQPGDTLAAPTVPVLSKL